MEGLHMYETIRASIPLDHKRNIHYCKNVKFHLIFFCNYLIFPHIGLYALCGATI